MYLANSSAGGKGNWKHEKIPSTASIKPPA